ncbi:MAG: FtsX-like permease family protein, partial [Saprospiraceae bacterium]|nr:FtsX-like permease family protein [Saprospiraceae bacterium]
MMLKNYLKTGVRSLFKHKLFSLTNIVGLSLGVLCCMMIMMYVVHETSFDQWNSRIDRLVRPYADINFGGTIMTMAVTGAPLAPDAQAILPEIEDWCRFRNYGSYLVKVEGSGAQNILVEEALSVDSSFLNLFPVPLLDGDPLSCLKSPQTLLISETLALKLFNSTQQAVGSSLQLDNDRIWKITGVFADLPATTHFRSDLLLSLNGNREIAEAPPLWAANNNFHTYFLLREGTDYEIFSKKFEKLSREKMEITSSTLLGMSLEDFEKTGQYARYPLQRVADIHLHSDLTVELQPNGDFRYVWIFSAIALFVLIIACINFMNLTTAKASQRVKEISVRKVMGSSRQQLIFQFLTEAMLMATISVMIALASSFFILPWYNDLTGASLQLPY